MKCTDYDVAVFLRDMADRFAEMNRLADLSTKIIVEEDGPFIHAMPYRAGSYNGERMPLMHDIRADGIELMTPQTSDQRSLERLDDIFAHLLGVAEQHHRVVAVEQLVVDAGVARGHRALDEEHGLGTLDLEDRHAVYRR